MEYAIEKIKAIVKLWKESEVLSKEQQKVIYALISLGRDKESVNRERIYNCKSTEIESIRLRIMSSDYEGDKAQLIKKQLSPYLNDTNTIMRTICDCITESEIQSYNNIDLILIKKYISAGLEYLIELADN